MDSLPIESPRRVPSAQNNHCSLVARPMKALPQRALSNSFIVHAPRPASSIKTPPPPHFSGNFNLFSSSSSSIPNHLLTASDGTAYRTLYKMLSSENPSSSDVQCFLPDPLERQSRHGLVRSSIVRDPLNNEQLDIGLHDIRETGFSSGLQRKSSDVDMDSPPPSPSPNASAPRLSAGAHVIGEGSVGDIIDGFGEFVIRRAWCEVSEDGTFMEIFEGHFELQIFFGDLYRERGLADVTEHRFDFWAVRSRKGVDG
jgi:hypothetical protein